MSLRTLALEWATERSDYIRLLADYKARTERQARHVSSQQCVELKCVM